MSPKAPQPISRTSECRAAVASLQPGRRVASLILLTLDHGAALPAEPYQFNNAPGDGREHSARAPARCYAGGSMKALAILTALLLALGTAAHGEPNIDEAIAAQGNIPGVAPSDRLCFAAHLQAFKIEVDRMNTTLATLQRKLLAAVENRVDLMATTGEIDAELARHETAQDALDDADVDCRLRARGER
jgi:hypothetical protein